jgi:hypothetical protein
MNIKKGGKKEENILDTSKITYIGYELSGIKSLKPNSSSFTSNLAIAKVGKSI